MRALKNRRGRVAVTWTRVAATDRYDVLLRYADGRRTSCSPGVRGSL